MLVIVETVQDQEEGRREVGCQSEPVESRDVAVQVDLNWRLVGVADIPWQCVSVRADKPGGGALLHHSSTNATNVLDTRPTFYSIYPPYTETVLPTMPLLRPAAPDLQQLHPARSLSSMPLYQTIPLLPQAASPVLQSLPLPSMPLWSVPSTAGVQRDASPSSTPADTLVPPPGLIAPLSPRLAEDEEEGSLLKQGKGVCGNKHSIVTSEKKKRMSQCREKSQPAFKQTKRITGKVTNTMRGERKTSSTVCQKRSSEESEDSQLDHCQHVLHPVESSAITKTQQSGGKTVQPAVQIQHTSTDKGKEEGEGVKPVKKINNKTEQAGRPRRKTVGPPIRYLLESEVRSDSLSASSHSRVKVKKKMESKRKEHEAEREEVEVTERTDSSRVASPRDEAVGGWSQPCQVCGLVFTKQASLQLHQSVHKKDHPRPHCGNRGSAHGNKEGHCDTMTKAANKLKEVEDNTKSEGAEDREEKSEEEEKKPLPPPPTVSSDWSRHTNRVTRNLQWWADFRTQMKRRQESRERWRRQQENNGGKERKRKTRREEEEEEKEKKRVCVKDEGGEEDAERRNGGEEKGKEVKQVCVKAEGEGEDAQKRSDGGEEKKQDTQMEAKKEVMELPPRPRRKMVGPPIRYLVESEEQSHGPVTANQDTRKPKKKKSNAEGGASDITAVIDKSERQTGRTNQEAANKLKQRNERPKKFVIDSKAVHRASDRETGQIVLERQTGHVSSEGESGQVALERQMGQMITDKQTCSMEIDRKTDQMISDRQKQTEKQTGHVVTETEVGHMVSEKETGHMVSESLTESQTGSKASEGETGDNFSEKQTGVNQYCYMIHRDLHNGQVTIIPPCCVRLQRLL